MATDDPTPPPGAPPLSGPAPDNAAPDSDPAAPPLPAWAQETAQEQEAAGPSSDPHDALAPVSEWTALLAGMGSCGIHAILIGLTWATIPMRILLLIAWGGITALAARRAHPWLYHPTSRMGWLFLGGWLLALQPTVRLAAMLAGANATEPLGAP